MTTPGVKSVRKTHCDTHDRPRIDKPTSVGTYCPDCQREQQEAYRRRMGRQPRQPRMTPEKARERRAQQREAKRLYELFMRLTERTP